MYNKKVLSNAMKNLASRKAPAKKKDTVVNNKLLPFISSEGYKQGPPPEGMHYRILGNKIYNPTPYDIKAVGSNGEQQFIAAGDTRPRTFDGALYVDEFSRMQRGGPTYADSLFLYNNTLKLDDWMRKNKYYWSKTRPFEKLPWQKSTSAILNQAKEMYALDKAANKSGRADGRKGSLQDYVKTKNNFVGTSDWWDSGGDDKGLPLTWLHPGINPQYEGDMVPKKSGSPRSYSYRYMPLAVKPAELLTDAEIIKRYKEYGKSGIPKSRLIKLGLIKPSAPTSDPVSLSFIPPTITDLEFEPPIEAETQWTNPNPEMDIEQRPKEPKTYIPEFARRYKLDPKNISNLYGLRQRKGKWIDVPIEQDGGDISIPDLNQYEDGGEYDLTDDQIAELKKGGYVVEELPKKKNSKKYSRSLLATNQLFAQNPLLKKQKSKKRKIFDPNAKYYQDGGEAVEQYQKGGPKEQYYTYANSKNKYKKVGNQWYISNEGTAFDFVPIKDPTGSRTKELNKNAKIDPYPWIPSKAFESKINTALGDPMGASGRAGEYYKLPDEDDVDNIRHAYSGYRTAKGIADATGNIPYVSNPLGYIGSSILGAAHEVGTMFSDKRDWSTKLSEAAEDQANNMTGAGMVFNQRSPAENVKRIAAMSSRGYLPDGYGGMPFGPDYIDLYDQRQQQKAFRESTGKPTPVSLTEKFEKGGFQDDINKRRKLLRDWTYGASIGMLQKAQEGLETRGTEEQPKELPEIKALDPNDEVTQLMKAKRDELSYAKNDRQKKRVSQRYDKLITEAKERRETGDEGNVLTGPKTGKQVQQEVLAAGQGPTRTGAERITRAERRRSEWEQEQQRQEAIAQRASEEEKAKRERQTLKESIDTSIDSGIGTSTYVDTPKFGDPLDRRPGETMEDVMIRQNKENEEAFVKYLVDASNKKIYGKGVGQIQQVTTPAEQYIKSIGLGNLLNEHTAYAILQDLMYQDPEGTAKGLEDAKYKVWQKSEKAAYDNLGFTGKLLNNTAAMIADLPFYLEQTIKGERSLVGQGQRSAGSKYYEDAQYYDKALGDKGDINALINLFNPTVYGAAAGEDALRGKYGDAAVNALQGVLAGASGAGIYKGLTGAGKFLNKPYKIFNPITNQATGYTVNPMKLINTGFLAEGVARDIDYTNPESTFYMADKLISGDKTWNESAAGLANNMLNYIGMKSTVDDIVSGWKEGGREALRVPASAVLKRWDKPLFSLTVPSLSNTLKQPTFGKGVKSALNYRIGARTPAVWNPETARYQVIGPRKIGQTNIAASDIARGITFSTAVPAGIGAYNSINNAIDVVGSDDKSFGEKYKAIKDAGYKTTGALIQAMAVPKVFRPIYASPYVNAYFAANYYDELLKGDVTKNPNPLRGVFSTSRLIAHKEGGETYEIDNNTRRVLAKLGYQVEDID
jgi:hypothetical protein